MGPGVIEKRLKWARCDQNALPMTEAMLYDREGIMRRAKGKQIRKMSSNFRAPIVFWNDIKVHDCYYGTFKWILEYHWQFKFLKMLENGEEIPQD